HLGGEIGQGLLRGDRLQHLFVSGGAQGHEGLAETPAVAPGPDERLRDDVVGNHVRLHEDLTQTERRRRGGTQGGRIMVGGSTSRQSSLCVDTVSLLSQCRGRGGRLLYVMTSSDPA